MEPKILVIGIRKELQNGQCFNGNYLLLIEIKGLFTFQINYHRLFFLFLLIIHQYHSIANSLLNKTSQQFYIQLRAKLALIQQFTNFQPCLNHTQPKKHTTMRHQSDSPQINRPSKDQDKLPQPVILFRQYVVMLRRDAEKKRLAKEEKERIMYESRRKEEEISYLIQKVEDKEKNFQLQVYQAVQSSTDLTSWWSCWRYNATLILTLALIILIVTYSCYPSLPSPNRHLTINRTICLQSHPEGWFCRMPEQQRTNPYEIVNGKMRWLDDKEIRTWDLAQGETLRRCGEKSNVFFGIDLAWEDKVKEKGNNGRRWY